MAIPTSGEKALSMVGKALPPVAGTLAFFGEPLQHGLQYGWESMITEYMIPRIANWRFPNIFKLGKLAMDIPVYRDNIIGGGITAIGIPIIQSLLRSFGIPLPGTVNSVLDIFKRTGAGAFAGGAAAALTWLPGAFLMHGLGGTTGTPFKTGDVQAWMGDY